MGPIAIFSAHKGKDGGNGGRDKRNKKQKYQQQFGPNTKPFAPPRGGGFNEGGEGDADRLVLQPDALMF